MLITFTGLTTIIILIQLYKYFNVVIKMRKLYNKAGELKKPVMENLEKIRKSIILQTVIILLLILLIALIVWCIRALHVRIKR